MPSLNGYVRAFFVAVQNWWGRLEPSSQLIFPSPPIFTCYSSYAMYEGRSSEEVMSIAVRKLVMMTTIYFLEIARDGVNWKDKSDWRVVDRGAF